MRPPFKFLAGVLAGIVATIILCVTVTSLQDIASAQPAATFTISDSILRTLSIYPAKSSNGTNAFAVYPKNSGGTNYFRIEPTNANINLRVVGSSTLYTGLTAQINVTGTNNGNFTNMFFKNGILIGNGP